VKVRRGCACGGLRLGLEFNAACGKLPLKSRKSLVDGLFGKGRWPIANGRRIDEHQQPLGLSVIGHVGAAVLGADVNRGCGWELLVVEDVGEFTLVVWLKEDIVVVQRPAMQLGIHGPSHGGE